MLRCVSICTTAAALAAFAGTAHAQSGIYRPVTDAMLENPSPGDWLMWRRTLNSWGFSPLTQIDRSNVAGLQLAWSIELDDTPSQEGIPLVHDGIMYFPAPLDVTLALDAATGRTIWEHRRELASDLSRHVPFPQTNRNLAVYGELVIDNGADDTIYALSAESGELVWQTEVLDFRRNPSKQGSGPLAFRGKLVSGRHCATAGGPNACVITAHDALTGKELWRKRTIPKPGEPGGDSWGDVPYEKRWHVGAWMIPSYDPALDLVYMGTSVTAPAPKFMLAGNDKKYLYHNSTLALIPETGATKWYYQHDVDNWDMDHPYERLLIDTAVAPNPAEVPWINPRLRPGERRKVVTGIPGKTGIVYTLDRETGEFLWARPTVRQNVVTKIDGATGAVTMNPDTQFTGPDQTVFVCPTSDGGKNWPAGAYSPRTKTMYFPMQNTCMNSKSIASVPKPELVYAINNQTMIAPGTQDVGTVQAIAVESGKTVWKHDQRAGVTGLLATGGDLVFGGDVGGKFRALDADTGKVLWETDLGSQVTGHPVTFAVAGKQYVAVSTGRSNLTGGLARLTPDVAPEDNRNRLFVFALGN